MDGSAGESQDRSSCINCFPASKVNRELLGMVVKLRKHEHLISSILFATCWITKVVSCAAAFVCLPSESRHVGKF